MDIFSASLVLGKLQHGERRIMYTSPEGVQVTATQTGRFSPHDFARKRIEGGVNDASVSIL